MMAFIRGYKPSDFEATAHICRATLPPSLSASADARRLAPYLWTHQYTHLCPDNCFVLDDGTGRAVGYCIGCPDVRAFCAAYPSYVQEVLEPSDEIDRPADMSTRQPWIKLPEGVVNGECLAQKAYNPDWLFDGNHHDEALAKYRATLHIDLLPEWQRKGWGTKLLERVVKTLAESGSDEDGRGVWIGVALDNAHVVRFYEEVGFRVLKKEGGIILVRDF